MNTPDRPRPKASRQKAPRHSRETAFPWRMPVAVAEIPATGQSFALAADAPTREALAPVAGVDAVLRLEAAFAVVPHGRGGLRVTGAVSARVGQTCVVTLEPLENDIREEVDVVFVPPGEEAARAPSEPAGEDGEGEDPPEVLDAGRVDLGALAVEFLALAVDPYPRRSGAAFQAPAPAADPADRPFAALAALKGRRDGNGQDN